MPRIALGVEYTGTNYSGWQIQQDPAVPSIQAEVERALGIVANHKIATICAGRTDAGVHASGQVIHADVSVARNERSWVYGCNTNLPRDIRILWAKEVADTFDARKSAAFRQYKYLLFNSPTRPSLLQEYLAWHYAPLNIQAMERAAQNWIGEHDFTSFRAAGCQSKSPIRNITSISIKRSGEIVIFDIMANAFLYHMVRNMVGSLCSIGMGKMPVEWSKDLLIAKDRTKASATAPPQGLYLANVYYPDWPQIPQNTTELWFLKQG